MCLDREELVDVVDDLVDVDESESCLDGRLAISCTSAAIFGGRARFDAAGQVLSTKDDGRM